MKGGLTVDDPTMVVLTLLRMSHKTAGLSLGIPNSAAERAGTTTPAVVAAAVIAVAQCCLLLLLLLHSTATTTTTSIRSDASSEVSLTTITVYVSIPASLPFLQWFGIIILICMRSVNRDKH